MKKYKANYDWCHDEDELLSGVQYDSGSIEVEADDYQSAKEISIKEIREYEKPYGGYLTNLEITEINQKDTMKSNE